LFIVYFFCNYIAIPRPFLAIVVAVAEQLARREGKGGKKKGWKKKEREKGKERKGKERKRKIIKEGTE